MPALSSLRLHPALRELFAQAEGRHLTDDELERLLAVGPELAGRIDAAREVRTVDPGLVRALAVELNEIYPLAQFHEYALHKSVRDLRYVSAYATLAMVMADPRWLHDKLLLWLRRILLSLEFPDIPAGTTRRLNPAPEVHATLAALPPHQRVIYDTYYRLRVEFRRALSPAAFAEMDPYLQATLDVLGRA